MQSFNENMLGKFLGFGRMQQNIILKNIYYCFYFFLKYFGENRIF
jgi:hypothetical protein